MGGGEWRARWTGEDKLLQAAPCYCKLLLACLVVRECRQRQIDCGQVANGLSPNRRVFGILYKLGRGRIDNWLGSCIGWGPAEASPAICGKLPDTTCPPSLQTNVAAIGVRYCKARPSRRMKISERTIKTMRYSKSNTHVDSSTT